MEAVANAIKQHASACPYPVTCVLMHPVDLDRCGWEDGDVILEVPIKPDPSVGTGSFRLICDGVEPPEVEAIDAVGREVHV